jgi:hypothetical protein
MIKEFGYLDEPPILEYKGINKDCVFIGCIIKSLYDENRIIFKDNINPKRISHCERNLYGLTFDPQKRDQTFLNYLRYFKNIDLYSYNKILREYSMSCDENFGYLEKGLYPVDSKYIEKYMSDFKYDLLFEDNVEMPNYQRIKSINMFYLSPLQN